MVPRTVPVALAAALVTALAPVAQSQPAAGTPSSVGSAQVGTWGSSARLDRGEIVLSRKAIAVDPRGDVTAVWGCAAFDQACASSLQSGGAWEPRENFGEGSAPVVAVGSSGVATAVWSGTDGLVAARKRPGRPWSAPVVLDKRGWRPDLVLGPFGRVTVAWVQQKRGGDTRIRAAARLVRGTWTKPVNVTKPVGVGGPQLGSDDMGVVTLVYVVGAPVREDDPGVLTSQRWVRGAGWDAPVVLAHESETEVLATHPTGDAVVVYRRKRSGRLHAVVRAAGQSWGTPEVLSPAGVPYLSSFSAAIDADRSVLVAYARSTRRVDLVRRPPAGPWSAPTQLAARGGLWVEVRASASGAAFVAWAARAVYGMYRPAGGTWEPQHTIARKGNWPVEDFDVAMGPTGDVAVLWSREERFRLLARVLTVPRP